MMEQTESRGIPDRVVLERMPKVGFYDGTRCPE